MQHAHTLDMLQALLQLPIDQIIEGPEWYRLRHELFALGLHNDLMAPKVSELLREGRESIAAAITNALGETSVEPLVLATLLLTFFDGLALQKIMDPSLDISMFAPVLAEIFLSLQKKEQ